MMLSKERPDPDILLTLLSRDPPVKYPGLKRQKRKGEMSKLELPASALSRSSVLVPAPETGTAPRP